MNPRAIRMFTTEQDVTTQNEDFIVSDEKKPNLPSTTEDTSSTDLDVIPEDTASNPLSVVLNFISGLDPNTWLARNASKAFDKLCSAPKEWFDAYFEGKAAESRAESEGRVKIIEAGTDQIIQQMQVRPEYAKRAADKFAEKIIGEQINLDKISGIAADELKNIESDTPTIQNTNEPHQEQSADSTNQDANSSGEKVIDDVWLNIFEREARPQSTEEGQLLFGRILAGEIRNPGGYSFRTLKSLGELDENVAALFKNFCSTCIFLEHPADKIVIDIRVPSLWNSPGKNGLRKYGLPFNRLNTLNEYGLIISDYNSGVDYQVSIMDKDYRVLAPFQHQGQYWVLLPSPDREYSEEFRIWGVALSQVGRELFQIVDQDPTPEYTADLKEYFSEQKLQMVAVPGSGPIVMNSTITKTESMARLRNVARDKIGD